MRDLRPIAMTDISYKVYMSLLKNEIEQHLERNGQNLETQAGFTRGARVEDNVAIQRYIKLEAQRKRNKLIITGVDFSKAYDSVKRETIIATLKAYKIHAQIILSGGNIQRR